jgi:hypothetical protein
MTLWGRQILLLDICGFRPRLTLKYYMTLWGCNFFSLLAICGVPSPTGLTYVEISYMTDQVIRVSNTKFIWSAIGTRDHEEYKPKNMMNLNLSSHLSFKSTSFGFWNYYVVPSPTSSSHVPLRCVESCHLFK